MFAGLTHAILMNEDVDQIKGGQASNSILWSKSTKLPETEGWPEWVAPGVFKFKFSKSPTVPGPRYI